MSTHCGESPDFAMRCKVACARPARDLLQVELGQEVQKLRPYVPYYAGFDQAYVDDTWRVLRTEDGRTQGDKQVDLVVKLRRLGEVSKGKCGALAVSNIG